MSVEKSNVMHSGVLWREVTAFMPPRARSSLVMYADNCAMQLVRNPKRLM